MSTMPDDLQLRPPDLSSSDEQPVTVTLPSWELWKVLIAVRRERRSRVRQWRGKLLRRPAYGFAAPEHDATAIEAAALARAEHVIAVALGQEVRP